MINIEDNKLTMKGMTPELISEALTIVNRLGEVYRKAYDMELVEMFAEDFRNAFILSEEEHLKLIGNEMRESLKEIMEHSRHGNGKDTDQS